MGAEKPEGLKISRSLWLDENGGGITFRDQILGRMQQIWRLDIAPDQELGAVRSNGQGQLITRNPNGAAGIEIRSRTSALKQPDESRRPAISPHPAGRRTPKPWTSR
jgi:hypothetical protein